MGRKGKIGTCSYRMPPFAPFVVKCETPDMHGKVQSTGNVRLPGSGGPGSYLFVNYNYRLPSIRRSIDHRQVLMASTES